VAKNNFLLFMIYLLTILWVRNLGWAQLGWLSLYNEILARFTHALRVTWQVLTSPGCCWSHICYCLGCLHSALFTLLSKLPLVCSREYNIP
jgi:hypothetical protein